MGIYYSLYEWYHPLWQSDRKRYVDEHLFPQFKDVVTRCQPALIFSDGEWEMDSKDWKTGACWHGSSTSRPAATRSSSTIAAGERSGTGTAATGPRNTPPA